MRCPDCQSSSFRLSHRRTIEHVLGLFLPIRPYRCNSCERRVWGLARPIFTLMRLVLGTILLLGLLVMATNFWLALQSARSRAETAPRTNGGAANSPAAFSRPGREHGKTSRFPKENEPDARKSTGEPVVSRKPPHSQERAARRPRQASGSGQGISSKPAITVAEKPPKPEPEPKDGSKPAQGETEAAFMVQRLDVSSTARRIDIRLGTNAMPGDYKLFSIESRHQLVLDLPGKWSTARTIPRSLALDTPLAYRVRTGNHPGYFRLVIDLRPGIVPVAEAERYSSGLHISIVE